MRGCAAAKVESLTRTSKRLRPDHRDLRRVPEAASESPQDQSEVAVERFVELPSLRAPVAR